MYRVVQAQGAHPATVEWNYRTYQRHADTSFIAVDSPKSPILASARFNPGLADCLHLSVVSWEGANMALSKEGLIQELKHEIHSPLAAIRNALYLATVRTDDPEMLRYLALADAEIARITAVLKYANQIKENKHVHVLRPVADGASAA
jgi:nitrogen-specific signal transduction histidine kinase